MKVSEKAEKLFSLLEVVEISYRLHEIAEKLLNGMLRNVDWLHNLADFCGTACYTCTV